MNGKKKELDVVGYRLTISRFSMDTKYGFEKEWSPMNVLASDRGADRA
jgi:hypothetical protein